MPIEKPTTVQISKKLASSFLTKTEFLKSQFRQHVSTAIIAAFSFLIALSWKDVITNAVNALVKSALIKKIPYLSGLISAVIITLIAVLGIWITTVWAKPKEINN